MTDPYNPPVWDEEQWAKHQWAQPYSPLTLCDMLNRIHNQHPDLDPSWGHLGRAHAASWKLERERAVLRHELIRAYRRLVDDLQADTWNPDEYVTRRLRDIRKAILGGFNRVRELERQLTQEDIP